MIYTGMQFMMFTEYKQYWGNWLFASNKYMLNASAQTNLYTHIHIYFKDKQVSRISINKNTGKLRNWKSQILVVVFVMYKDWINGWLHQQDLCVIYNLKLL